MERKGNIFDAINSSLTPIEDILSDRPKWPALLNWQQKDENWDRLVSASGDENIGDTRWWDIDSFIELANETAEGLQAEFLESDAPMEFFSTQWNDWYSKNYRKAMNGRESQDFKQCVKQIAEMAFAFGMTQEKAAEPPKPKLSDNDLNRASTSKLATVWNQADVDALRAYENIEELKFYGRFDVERIALPFRENPMLREVQINWNTLGKTIKTLDLSENESIEELEILSDTLKTLYLPERAKVRKILLRCGALEEINFGAMKHLREMDLGEARISSLDLRECSALENFDIYAYAGVGSLTSVKLGEHPHLKSLSLTNQSIRELDLSGCANLERLNTASNQKFTSLDLSNNSTLEKLWCHTTGLQTIDLLNNPRLKELHVDDTRLGSLDLSACRDLEKLGISGTDLKEIDLSPCRKLRSLCINKALRRKIKLDETPKLKERGAISLR